VQGRTSADDPGSPWWLSQSRALAASDILRRVTVSTSERGPERGAGGTPGGVGQFFIGLVMVVAGGYLILNQVTVTTSFWRFGAYGGFGLSLLPLLVGIAVLFYNGKSVLGWVLTVAGATIILASVLMHMDIYFRATSLFNTLIMLGLLFGGLGVVARSLR
jgi:hypothetical protein